jgi:hypothetical protein
MANHDNERDYDDEEIVTTMRNVSERLIFFY